MRTRLTTALTLTALLTLTACGNDADNQEPEETTPVATTATNEPAETTISPTQEPDNEEPTEETTTSGTNLIQEFCEANQEHGKFDISAPNITTEAQALETFLNQWTADDFVADGSEGYGRINMARDMVLLKIESLYNAPASDYILQQTELLTATYQLSTTCIELGY